MDSNRNTNPYAIALKPQIIYYICTMKEIWKDINGFVGLYEVSNTGEVLSHITNKILIKNDCKGYKRVCLFKNKKRHYMSIHRLVAQHFIENPLGLPEINHKNGIKSDNLVDNLEWSTPQLNTQHAYDNDLAHANFGEKHYRCKLTTNQIEEIRNLHGKKKATVIASDYGIHLTYVYEIFRNVKRKNG